MINNNEIYHCVSFIREKITIHQRIKVSKKDHDYLMNVYIAQKFGRMYIR